MDPSRSPTRVPVGPVRFYSPSTAPRIPARRELSCLRWQEEGQRPQKRPEGRRWSVRCHLLSAAAGPSAALTRSCRGGAPSFIPHRPGWSLAGAGTGQGPVWPRQRPRQRPRPRPRWHPHLLPRGVPVLAPGSQSFPRGASPCPALFRSRSRDPDSPSSNLGVSPPGVSEPLPGSRLCPRSRQGRGEQPPTGRGEGTDRTPLPLRVPRHRGQSQSVGRERMG